MAYMRAVIVLNPQTSEAWKVLDTRCIQETQALFTQADASILPAEMRIRVYESLFSGYANLCGGSKDHSTCPRKCYERDVRPCEDHPIGLYKHIKASLHGTSMLTGVAETWYRITVLYIFRDLCRTILHKDLWEAGVKPLKHIRALVLRLDLHREVCDDTIHVGWDLRRLCGMRENAKVLLSIRHGYWTSGDWEEEHSTAEDWMLMERDDEKFVLLGPFFQMIQELRESGLNVFLWPHFRGRNVPCVKALKLLPGSTASPERGWMRQKLYTS